MPRYVVLHHEMPSGSGRASHWDLMLEDGPALRTFALAGEPLPGTPIDAEELAPHRAAYLDYEGPVSGGRGTVTRWDAGEYETLSQDENELRLMFTGRRLRGPGLLRRGEGENRWIIALEE
jgi:hypothetical protein